MKENYRKVVELVESLDSIQSEMKKIESHLRYTGNKSKGVYIKDETALDLLLDVLQDRACDLESEIDKMIKA